MTQTRFFQKTYEDTFLLLVKARDRFNTDLPLWVQGSKPLAGLMINREAMRVTSRLTTIMSWLLAQKAYHAGEITRKEATENLMTFKCRQTCLAPAPKEVDLPSSLKDLLDKSLLLYQRVDHLAMLQKKTSS